MRNPQTADLVVAPLGLRLLAFGVDIVILSLINLTLAQTLFPGAEIRDPEPFVVAAIVNAVYYIGFVAVYSATPGKLMAGIYVGDTSGRRVLPDAAILRYLAYFLGWLSIVGAGLSIWLALADPQRRSLHDRVARTLVLRGKAEQRTRSF